MRIVFMGTPDFAAAHLKALLDAGYEIPAVYTQPDKSRDRGMKLSFSPVKALAVEAGIPVLQPEKLRTEEAGQQIEALSPDLLVVVAYGRILPERFLNAPRLGAVNVHASLLPKYRGSAPIQWAVLNGDRTTGVTTMHMAPEMDAGDIIYQQETPIGEFETSGELFDRLQVLGCALLLRTVRDLESGEAPRTPQDASQATFTTQLTRELSPIDWNHSPREIVKKIYGLQPWPTATALIGGETLKVFAAAYTEAKTDKAPGTVVSAGKEGIGIACAGGETLLITEVQRAGKKRMKAGDYLAGHRIDVES